MSDPYDIVVELDETNNGLALAETVSIVPGYVAKPLRVVTAVDTAVAVELDAIAYGTTGPRILRVLTAPTHGSLNVSVGANLWGSVLTYTPNAGFSGVDTFEYEAYDFSSAYPLNDVRARVRIGVGEAGVAQLVGQGLEVSVGEPTVERVNTAPVIVEQRPQPRSLVVGESVDVLLDAVDIEGDALTWSAEELPAGLTIDARSGRISGAATEAGVVGSLVIVSDGELASSVTLEWVVAESPDERES